MNRPLHRLLFSIFSTLIFLFLPALAHAQRTALKPGINSFSPQQDIDLGKKAALDAERKLPLCNAAKVDAYLTQLGLRLAAKLDTHGVQYPWEFHCVNDKAINAFALPGGYVFVNRGAIESADNEAQLAGVMAHELSHVALRHGTNQVTKAQGAQTFLGLAGAIFGGSNVGTLATELGTFAAGGLLLRYSRGAETQADVMGTQVLSDTDYDPRALAQFFEKLEADSKGKNPAEFFSDHPSPEHRVGRVLEEVDRLGGVKPDARRDSAEFEAIKREVLALPVVAKATPAAKGSSAAPAAGSAAKPSAASQNFVEYQAAAYNLKYPDNWKKYGEAGNVTFAPDAGVVDAGNGQGALAYGMTVGVVKTGGEANSPDALANATQQLIAELQKENPNMNTVRESQRVKLNGEPGLSTYLRNDSPAGGQETDWIITVLRPQGLLFFVCVAPTAEYDDYDKIFVSILDSVRLLK